MNIILSPTSIGVSLCETTLSHDICKLSDDIYLFFRDKTYSKLVETLEVEFFCDSYLNPYKRPYYTENISKKIPSSEESFTIYHKLVVDIEIPKDEVLHASSIRLLILKEFIKYFAKTTLPVKIRKSFDKERFVADLKAFFDSYSAWQGK